MCTAKIRIANTSSKYTYEQTKSHTHSLTHTTKHRGFKQHQKKYVLFITYEFTITLLT